MIKRILALALLACLVLALLAACGKNDGVISAEKAQKIVLEHLGVASNQATMHIHTGDYEGRPCYSIYATVEGKTWEYLVDAATGEILSVLETKHSH